MQSETFQPRFQAGGTLSEGAIYVERPADHELPAALMRGELCYVLAPRQIGKSSLRARTAQRLEAMGFRCVTIDVTALGTHDATAAQWYFDLIAKLAVQLGLPYPDIFWRQHELMSPVHRWSLFLSDVVLLATTQPIAIFIDEIDATLALQPAIRDDFFASLRAIYNMRASEPIWRRLSVCLFGVAMPWDLIKDPTRTPFNIGRSISIEDVTREQMAPFGAGMQALCPDTTALLDAIFTWTEGHPYMVQKICQALCDRGVKGPQDVDAIVADLFLRRGVGLEPNLWYAERCFSRTLEPRTAPMLRLYGRLRAGEQIVAQNQDPIQMALRLTGIAAERRVGDATLLRVRNRIFATVFDSQWVREQEASRSIVSPLNSWLQSGRKNDYVLRGEALGEVLEWARDRTDLAPEENAFMMVSLTVARQEERQQRDQLRDREKAIIQRRFSAILGVLVVLLTVVLGVFTRQYAQLTAARNRAEDYVEKSLIIVENLDLLSGAGATRRQLLVDICRQLEKISANGVSSKKVINSLFKCHIAFGELFSAQGQLFDAEKEFTTAYDIAEHMPDNSPERREIKLATSLSHLGEIAEMRGQLDVAEDFFQRMLKLTSELVQVDSGNPDAQSTLSISLERIGGIAFTRGHLTEAHNFYQRKLELDEARLRADPNGFQAQYDLPASLERLGSVAMVRGRWEEAEGLYSRKLALNEAYARLHPTNSQSQHGISVSLERLGDIARARGQEDSAQKYYERKLHLDEAHIYFEPIGSQARNDLSVGLQRLGNMAMARSQWGKAQNFFLRKLELDEERALAQPDIFQARYNVAVSLELLGSFFLKQRQWDQAQEFLDRALHSSEKLLAENPEDVNTHHELLAVRFSLADLYLQKGDGLHGCAQLKAAEVMLKRIRNSRPVIAIGDKQLIQSEDRFRELARSTSNLSCSP